MDFVSRFCLIALTAALCTMAHADCTIYVTHNGDADPPFWSFSGGSDNQMLFREAAEVGNGDARCYTSFEKDRIFGGNFVNDPVFCGSIDNSRNWRLSVSNPGCGPNNADTILFWDGIGGGSQIALGKQVVVDPRDSINGAALTPGARLDIQLSGPGPSGPTSNTGAIRFDNFSPAAASGSVRNLLIDNFRGSGIYARYVNGLSIKGVTISRISVDSFGLAYGVALGEITGPAIEGDCVFGAQVGGTGAGEQNYFYDIAYVAISLWDTCSGDNSDRNNKILNNYIGICEELDTGIGLDGCPAGTPNQAIGQFGVRISDTPNTRLGGAGANEGNYITRAAAAGVLLSGVRTRDTRIFGNQIGLSRTGFGRGNGAGVWLLNGPYQNQVGGTGIGEGNVISSNSQHGVRINAGDANSVAGNVIGLNPTRTQARGNGSDGVAINGGSTHASVLNNVIGYNAGWGVYMDGGNGHNVGGNVIGLRGATNISNDNTAAPNAGGVWINNIGGNSVGSGNRIAANTSSGIYIGGDGADGNVVRGNIIGLSSGNDRRPNNIGILIEGGPDDTVIGGSLVADRNTISGNTFEGVRIKDVGTLRSSVRGNYIGTTPNGLGAAQNASRGVVIDSGAASSEVIGNLISGNNIDGVALIGAGTATKVRGNTVGLSANGAALPNTASGIAVAAATTGALIGDVSAPNTVAANGAFGIFVADTGTTGNSIAGNTVGSATPGLANGAGGITLRANANANTVSSNTVIGHGGGPGIEIIGSHNNTVRANRVGLTGAGVIAANQAGVRVVGGATGNTIGGAVADRNLISGNALYGLTFAEAGTSSNTALNNYIGVDAAGTSARANGLGVLIEGGASNNTVSINLISGNSGDGALVQGSGSDGNRLQRNRIGLAASGSAVIANGGNGIRIGSNASGTLIGGLAIQDNLIGGNALAGVRVESGSGNDISFNSIVGNAGLGIDLGTLGITPNDALDADTGANGLQNFATLSNVLQNGTVASMTVVQNGLPSTQHNVLVYANNGCDPSGNGEGETYLDVVAITTNGSGNGSANVMIPLPSAAIVPMFAATSNVSVAAGENTSEFSPCAPNGALTVNLFANGFETLALGPVAAKAGMQSAASSIVRSSAQSATLTLVFENTTTRPQPARSLSISSDRAVAIESIHAQHMACDLLGAIVCELPMLAPGAHAEVHIALGTGADALTMSVREAGAEKVERVAEFVLLPY